MSSITPLNPATLPATYPKSGATTQVLRSAQGHGMLRRGREHLCKPDSGRSGRLCCLWPLANQSASCPPPIAGPPGIPHLFENRLKGPGSASTRMRSPEPVKLSFYFQRKVELRPDSVRPSGETGYPSLRYLAGGRPTSRLKALRKAASDS